MKGKVLDGKYRLIRLIGEGGMGSVYEAEHTILRRRVAVKVLREKYNTKSHAVERFVREARAASAIGHPNIVEIQDVGTEAGGTNYMVMELLSGESLDQHLKKVGALPPGRAVSIILQMLSALLAAHKKGIVHRDLKPENVFLAVDARMREEVKLLDFGVAKFLGLEEESLRLAKDGAIHGTPHYMSPEQAKGEQNTDNKTDIWSAGVLLYEMLSCRLPFDGANYNEIIGSILLIDPEPLTEVAPGVPPDLAKAVEKAMAKDRDKRYDNVAQMIGDLLPFYDNEEYAMSASANRVMRDSVEPPPPYGGRADTDDHAIKNFAETITSDSVLRGRRLKLLIPALAAAGAVLAGGILTIVLTSSPGGEKAVVSTSPKSSSQPKDDTASLDDKAPGKKPGGQAKGISSETGGDSTEAPESPKGGKVEIEILGLVRGAVVKVDGKTVTSPFVLPKSKESVFLEITARGYEELRTAFAPDRDKAIRIEMVKARPAKRETDPDKLEKRTAKPKRKPKKRIPEYAENPFE